eukprot:PITA_35741
MMGQITMQKYVDLGSLIVKTHINGIEIPNTLIDLGAAINIMSRQTMEQLKLPKLLFTPTLLQLADRSVIKPYGVLEDISVSLDSWEYPVDFMILTPKSNLGGHPLILGRPWLATVDAFSSCRSGDMYISDGSSTKKFTLYPPAKSITEVRDNEWVDDEDTIQPIFTLSEVSEDSQILNTLENFETSSEYDHAQFQLDSDIEYLSSRQMSLYSMEEFGSSAVEIFPGKTLNINKNLEKFQHEELTKILQKHSTAFAWEHTDTKVYGNTFEEALENLEKVLLRCKETNLSLSHEKCFMMFTEGIVLGHHISGDGIKVNRSKVEVISKLPIPNHQKDVRSFLGFTGYYRRFIENFTKITYPLFKLLTKDCEFKWSPDCQSTFESLKTRISEAPILRGPNWKLPFHISTDALDTALGAMLGQKDLVPYAIYYTSKKLTPTKLKYTVTEKEFLAVVHAINKFKYYITCYETCIYTGHSAIRYLMNKPVMNGRVTRWILFLQEFNITVLDRPRKQNTVADFLSRIQNVKEDSPIEDKFPDEYLFAVTTKTPWFSDMANYLVTGKLPPHLFPSERRKIIQESSRYSWISNKLFKTRPNLVIRRCVTKDEMPDILKACHDELCGGHFADKRTAYKILSLGYYWPSLFKDEKQYVKRCDSCQRVGKLTPSNKMPLQPEVLIEPFEKWALDFIGPISPPSKQKKYILVSTDYVIKWVEAKALFSATENSVVSFLYEDIFTRFGVPREIVTD